MNPIPRGSSSDDLSQPRFLLHTWKTVHSRQPFTYQRATTIVPSEVKQSNLSERIPHQKGLQGLPLHASPPSPPQVGVRGNRGYSSPPCSFLSWNWSGVPPPEPVGLVWSHLIQEGRPNPWTAWTGATQACLEFFRRQIDRFACCLQSSKRTGLG